MSLRLIGVPTSAGAYGIGQERAPAALRRSGLIEHVASDIVDDGDLPTTPFRPDPANRRMQNIDTVVSVASRVRDAVGTVVASGDTPIVLGGDCTITLGVVAGVIDHRPEAALAYFDGDVDLSTPATTRSGILDAMGIAHLLGIDGTDRRLAGIGPRMPLLEGRRMALIGFEPDDLNDDHRRLLDDHGVNAYPASDLRDDLEPTLRRIGDALGDRPRIVHFDIDAVDSIDCPLAEYPHFNAGVALDLATQVLDALCATPNLAALVVTEVNPLHDPEGIHIGRLRDTIVTALGSRT